MGDVTPRRNSGLLFAEPWLMAPAAFDELAAATVAAAGPTAANHAADAVLARGGERSMDMSTVRMRDGVAVMSIAGPILRYGDDFLDWLGIGYSSIETLARDFTRVGEDPKVAAIVLNLDSPGGMVSGTNEFAEMIHQARGRKPVIAYVNHMAASAAYWIASAADRIVADETAELGSIGVIVGMRKDDGRTVQIVSTASPKKRLDPETDSGRQELLKLADAMAEVFVAKVARNRGVGEDKVLADFGQGGMLVGRAAVAAGLADAVGSLEGVIAELRERSGNNRNRGGNTMKKFTSEELNEALAQIRADAPGMLNEVRDAARAEGVAAGIDQGRQAGQADERTRVMEILSADADPAVTRKAIGDGISADAAFKLFYEAEKNKRALGLQQMQQQATPPLGAEPPAEPAVKNANAKIRDAAKALATQKGISFAEAVKDVVAADKSLAAEWRPADLKQ